MTCKLLLKRYGPKYEVWKCTTIFDKIALAVTQDDSEMLELFFEDLKIKEADWALVTAAGAGHLHLVKYFFQLGGGMINIALWDATKKGHVHVAEYLVSEGAQCNEYVLLIALQKGYENMVEFCWERGVKLHDAVQIATKYGHTNVVRLLHRLMQ
jgi:hypothetical protein